MNTYSLKVDTTVNGGYLSSEQIDLLSIIQCNSLDELINFIIECDQINHLKDIENIIVKVRKTNIKLFVFFI